MSDIQKEALGFDSRNPSGDYVPGPEECAAEELEHRCLLCLDFQEKAAEFDRQCRIQYEYMVRARAAAAATVWEWRATARQVFASASTELPEALRITLLHNLVKGYHAPIKPSRRKLLATAKADLAYSRTTWCNPYDTEYYSA